MSMREGTRTIQVRRDYSIDVPAYGQHLDMSAIVDLMKRAGSHFFDADTMRYFRSRLDYEVAAGPDGWYFVTSEKHVHYSSYGTINEPRAYTVRRMSIAPSGDDLRLYELEGFQAFSSLRRARTAAKYAASTGCGICPDCSLRISHNPRCAECQSRRDRMKEQA